jgi:hypothetical protein
MEGLTGETARPIAKCWFGGVWGRTMFGIACSIPEYRIAKLGTDREERRSALVADILDRFDAA